MPGPMSLAELEDRLSEPTPAVVDTMARLSGDLLFLGVAGKMGPSLARMARRASDRAGVRRRIFGFSRFSRGGEEELRQAGIEPIRGDLLNEADVALLPEVANVVYMPGRKFGSTGDESMTWAINCYLPSLVCRRFPRARIVAFSTGNVYPFSPIASGGPTEAGPLNPVGEYGMSALGRERMFEYFSRRDGIPVAIICLNYAVDLRYGVLVDLAKKILAGESVDLSMGYFNCIWQGDANAMTLRAFDHVASPPRRFNVTGPETLSVRDVCWKLGQRLGVEPRFRGIESDTALLSNSQNTVSVLGPLNVSADMLIDWVADWIKAGGKLLDKPTHFESRDGRY